MLNFSSRVNENQITCFVAVLKTSLRTDKFSHIVEVSHVLFAKPIVRQPPLFLLFSLISPPPSSSPTPSSNNTLKSSQDDDLSSVI